MESRNYSQEGKVKVRRMNIATLTLRGPREGRNLSWRLKVKDQGLIQADHVDGAVCGEKLCLWLMFLLLIFLEPQRSHYKGQM